MVSTGRIRVLVVDDHEMVRQGLAIFLNAQADLQLVGQASDGAEALELCQEARPDVVLMDLVMPIMTGTEATRAIRERYPHIQVIALTSFPDEDMIQDVLKAGAIGFLFKNTSIEELASAIRMAYAGKPALAPEATRALLRILSEPQAITPSSELTARERSVIALMVQGLTNRQIAVALDLSPVTVKAYVSNILSKLNVSSRTEAVALALKNKLVT